MMSPFCMISCHVGTNFSAPVVGSPTRMKIFRARKCSDCASKGTECTCVHFFSLISSCHRDPVHLRLRNDWSNSDPSLILGFRIGSSYPGTPRPLATKKVIFETVSKQACPKNSASKFPWIGLGDKIHTRTLGAAIQSKPAYAELRPSVLAEAGVQMEVVSDSAPSVETILAKQLARRFREMSDEELVDILQQLLKASRSSLSSQNAVDDGIVPEDLVIQKEKRQIETKAAERTREEKVPATQESETNPGKEVTDKNTVSETQRPNVREGNGGEAPFHEAKTRNRQVDERKTDKFSDKANDQQQQGRGLLAEEENVGKISGDAQFSDTQDTLRGGNSASTVPPTTESNAGDASLGSKSDPSDTGQTSPADENVGEGSREDGNLTELLWAEWSRRIGSQVVEEPQTASASFNFVEFGQDVIKKVAAFTALQKAIGVFTMWSCFMVWAYRLGRARASSRKDTPTSKAAPINNQGKKSILSSDGRARENGELGPATLSEGFGFFQDSVNARISGLQGFMSKGKRVLDGRKREDNFEGGVSSVEGQSSMKSDQPENGQWWRTAMEDDLLADSRETSIRNQGIANQSPGGSGQNLNYFSNSSRNGTRSEPISSVGSQYDVSDMIKPEMKQLRVHRHQGETFGGPRTPLYPSKGSLNSVDSSSSELQAADQPRQRESQNPWQIAWRNTEVKKTGEQREQGELSTSDGSYVSTMSKIATADLSKGKILGHGRVTSPTGNLYSTGTTGTGGMTSPGQVPMNPQKPVDGDWENGSSRKFDSYEQVKHKYSLEGDNVKQGTREVEGTASQPEAKLNSFVHEHALWVRDDDGIFIKQAAAMEEGEGSKVTSFAKIEQGMPQATPSFDAERNSRKVERSNLPSSMGPMKQRNGPERSFDYRQLVMDSKDDYPPTNQQGFATDTEEPDALRQQTWPLRYGSRRQNVS